MLCYNSGTSLISQNKIKKARELSFSLAIQALVNRCGKFEQIESPSLYVSAKPSTYQAKADSYVLSST